MNKTAKALALMMALLLTLAGCGAIKTQTYSFAMGPKGSDFYALGEGICTDLTAGVSGVRFNPVESGGSVSNVDMLFDGSAQLAMMTADVAVQALAAHPKLRAVAPLFSQALHVVATGTSGIRSLFDLKARRVSLGTEGTGVAALAERIIAAAHLELRDIQRQYLEPAEAFEQMKSGKLDACFVLAAPGSSAIAQLAQEMDVVIVPLTDEAMRRLTENSDTFTEGEIPAHSYKNQDERVDAVFVDALVVTTSDLPDNVAISMAAVFREKAAETLKKVGIAAVTEGTVSNIPLHEGLESKKYE